MRAFGFEGHVFTEKSDVLEKLSCKCLFPLENGVIFDTVYSEGC